ncbi:hypothetical protein C5167_046376 [Papaver somniferum]|uniref:Protein kinase domain-containing protein n=1 Tax=Papaver somniferum TaxID=3469 RepID=A0A4Y7LHA4_PAPSO|nr:hypothetical protein C5167_046376 [Papaver somniferum]
MVLWFGLYSTDSNSNAFTTQSTQEIADQNVSQNMWLFIAMIKGLFRGMKPKSIRLATKGSPSPVKFADFGLAAYIQPEASWSHRNPFGITPEVLAGGYNLETDVWSWCYPVYSPSWDTSILAIQPGSRYLELAFSCVFFFMGHLYVGVIETCCRYPPQSVGVQEIACHMGLELGRYMFNYKTFKRMRMS